MIDLLYQPFFSKVEKCINDFSKWVFRQKEWINRVIYQHFNKDLTMTNKDEEIYNNLQICWICREDLNTDKVRDHCHITGKLRGAANNICNLKLCVPKKLPIIFHCLEGYDGHIILRN